MGVVIVDGLQKSLARKLAGFKIPDSRVNELAKSIFLEGARYARLDICAYGICLDYFVDRPKFFDDLIKLEGLRRVDVFPLGIPVPEMFHARLEIEVPEFNLDASAEDVTVEWGANVMRERPSGFLPRRTVHLHPTTRCNLACRHCYSSSSPSSSAVALNHLVSCMGWLRAEGYEVASLSGGEALLYPEIRPLISRLKAFGYQINLVSNGSTISSAFDDILDALDVIAVSFDGYHELHNEIRGSGHAFAHAVRGLQHLRARGRKTAIAYCVTRRSLPDIPQVVDLAIAHGVSLLQLRPIVLTGRAREQMAHDALGESDVNRLFLTAVALRQELGNALAIHLDLVHAETAAAHRDQYQALFNCADPLGVPLSDLVNPLVITAEGNVRPLTYGLDARFDLGLAAELDAVSLAEYKGTGVEFFRKHMIDAFERAATEEGLIDWFTFCSDEAAADRSAVGKAGGEQR